MLFTSPSNYLSACNWFTSNVTTNEAATAVFLMWLNTEMTYTFVVSFFYLVEKNRFCFSKYKIHKQSSDKEMFRSAIMFKPIAWLVDIPIYFLSFQMMGWNKQLQHMMNMAPNDTPYVPPSPMNPLPDNATLFRHVLYLTLIFDLLFYCWHRLLHTKSMWKFHKKHHDVKVSFSCANDHESVVELTGNILWKMIPPALIGCHVYTVCVFRAIVKFFALLHHSGFELPCFTPLQSIPGVSSPSHHDFHHYYGHGNYGGVFSIWDHLFGTYKDTSKMKNKQV